MAYTMSPGKSDEGPGGSPPALEEKSPKGAPAKKMGGGKEIPTLPGTLLGITHTRCKIVMLRLGLMALNELQTNNKGVSRTSAALSFTKTIAHFLDTETKFDDFAHCTRRLKDSAASAAKRERIPTKEVEQLNIVLQAAYSELTANLDITSSSEVCSAKLSQLQADFKSLQEAKDADGLLSKLSEKGSLAALVEARFRHRLATAMMTPDGDMTALFTLGQQLQHDIDTRPGKSKTELNTMSLPAYTILLGTLATEIAAHERALAIPTHAKLDTLSLPETKRATGTGWVKAEPSTSPGAILVTGVGISSPSNPTSDVGALTKTTGSSTVVPPLGFST